MPRKKTPPPRPSHNVVMVNADGTEITVQRSRVKNYESLGWKQKPAKNQEVN